jgi:ABC-2 type transport system ATP-binding protein
MIMKPVIETTRLTKRYGSVTAVDNLNLSLHQGEVFGLLGPNGSGKTTTILMLLGLTEPTSGKVRVLGFDPSRNPLDVKARVGYLPDSVGFYDELTAAENLRYIARLNRLSSSQADQRIQAALERMGLADVMNHRVRTFSHGMRQRLGMADVLIKQPEVVILDEPTLGLDPEAARSFLEIVRGLKEDGFTVLLSSHLLHQVQAVCDRVGLFRKGKMVLEGTVTNLALKVLGGAYRIHLETRGGDPGSDLEGIEGVVDLHGGADGQYVVESRKDLRAEVADAVIRSGSRLLSMRLEEPGLDEVYTHYFQEADHAAA